MRQRVAPEALDKEDAQAALGEHSPPAHGPAPSALPPFLLTRVRGPARRLSQVRLASAPASSPSSPCPEDRARLALSAVRAGGVEARGTGALSAAALTRRLALAAEAVQGVSDCLGRSKGVWTEPAAVDLAMRWPRARTAYLRYNSGAILCPGGCPGWILG